MTLISLVLVILALQVVNLLEQLRFARERRRAAEIRGQFRKHTSGRALLRERLAARGIGMLERKDSL